MADKNSPYVAVVAVHGVGDQTPNRTAQAVANLLLACKEKSSEAAQVTTDGRFRYTPFEEKKVRIAVRPLAAGRQEDHPHFCEQLTHKLLTNYEEELEDATYETVRIEGERLDDEKASQCKRVVHVYDMYWADLSRLGSGFLRAMGALFLLIFHLGDIGRQTAEHAGEYEKQKGRPLQARRWKHVRNVQKFAMWVLTCPLVILNLYELAIVLIVLPVALSEAAMRVVAIAALAIIVASVAGKVAFHYRSTTSFRRWLLWIAVTFVLVVAGILLAPRLGYYRLLAVEWTIIAVWLLVRLLRPYALLRDDAGSAPLVTRIFNTCSGLVAVGVFLFQVFVYENTKVDIYRAALHTIEVLFLIVQVFWFLLFAVIVWQGLLTAWIRWTNRGKVADQQKARRAAGTVLVTLAHPAALFRVLTLALWAATWGLLTLVVPPFEGQSYEPWFQLFRVHQRPEAGFVGQFIEGLLSFSQTPMFAVALIMIALALILVLIGLFPVVWAEIFPPRPVGNPEAQKRQGLQLGNWLTKGYQLFGWAAVCMFLAAPIMLVGYVLLLLKKLDVWSFDELLLASNTLKDFPFENLIVVISGVLSASFLSILSLGGPLEGLALGFHLAVRTSLDVDNYLREFPSKRTPRARIFARYASLLRYLCRQHGSDATKRYRAIIIVAHSQGTVITADLLRFLQNHQDDVLLALRKEIPVYFLTVGSPLRQLYGWRLPHLYDWAYHYDEPPEVEPLQIPKGRAPDPGQLGLARWLNAYRSGDYIGRYLWRSDLFDEHWDSSLKSTNEYCGEGCIGAGAHNRYLEETLAQTIGKQLDDLIVQATTEPTH
ncbi:MAG: hypothetical protein L0Y72_23530 [Gemmataceae bacterium]|nr:hypothetical protein [Gemmataceae bacterium]MCI0742016.1 hypothetical protein [Gemmataceae bacterium]